MDFVAPSQLPPIPTPSSIVGDGASPVGDGVSPSEAEHTASAPPRPDAPRRTSRVRRSTSGERTSANAPAAPLVRPDGSPAPVVHLAAELAPFARTGGLGEAGASLDKSHDPDLNPITVFMTLSTIISECVEQET